MGQEDSFKTRVGRCPGSGSFSQDSANNYDRGRAAEKKETFCSDIQIDI